MFAWLVTVRAADASVPAVYTLLRERLLPMLRAQAECTAPAVARCVNCGGEFTYMAPWAERHTLEAFEASADYAELVSELGSRLRLPAKRELWELLAS